MLRIIQALTLAVMLSGCASHLEVVVENRSDEPLDLVISTPKPRERVRMWYGRPGRAYHIEIAPGERWRSSSATRDQVLDEDVFGDNVMVIERECHLRSKPAPSGSRVTVFEATAEQRQVVLVFDRESAGWGYTAMSVDGSPITPVLVETERRWGPDVEDLLERWAGWERDEGRR